MRKDLQTKKAHFFALKRLLNVSTPKKKQTKKNTHTKKQQQKTTTTTNKQTNKQTNKCQTIWYMGRSHLDAKVSSIRFWLRLMRMRNERLPRKAYNMLVNIHNGGKQCWVLAIRVNLMMCGFGYVWINQGVQNINWFLRVFRERISDCWK